MDVGKSRRSNPRRPNRRFQRSPTVAYSRHRVETPEPSAVRLLSCCFGEEFRATSRVAWSSPSHPGEFLSAAVRGDFAHHRSAAGRPPPRTVAGGGSLIALAP